MKRLFLLLFFLLFLFLPHYAFADEGWVVENFHSDIAIQQTGKVRVVETISVDFRNQHKHGIYRDIPYLYESNGTTTYTDVVVTDVLQNTTPVHYTTSEKNGYKELKIGDANKTFSGRTIYTITYVVTGVLRGFSSYDELYWNVTGNGWNVPIQKADAVVTLPKEGITQVACFEGVSGSKEPCSSQQESSQIASFATTRSLGSSEGLTLVVGYNKNLIPLVTVQRPKSFGEKLVAWPSLVTLFIVLLCSLGVVMFVWFRSGRDFWFAGNIFGTKTDKGKKKPIGAHETISVEFLPPEKLRPAEIGVLLDERADTLDVVATIIDLATRGYLTITEIPKKWMFGKVDYLLIKTTPKTTRAIPQLLAYEQLLLDKLFYRRKEVKLSSLKMTFYKDLRAVKKALYEEVVSKSLFPSDPEKVRNTYLSIAVTIVIFGVFATVLGSVFEFVWLVDIAVGIGVGGFVFVIVSRFMPYRTAYGRELYRRSKGYRLFIERAEKYRQRFFEKKNMFNEVLPYAIVFGMTEKFAKQMDKLGVEPEQTTWYHSTHTFSTAAFVGSMNSFSQSLSTAIASTPSSSGGFSGGSSGGGFGGGGGGSW